MLLVGLVLLGSAAACSKKSGQGDRAGAGVGAPGTDFGGAGAGGTLAGSAANAGTPGAGRTGSMAGASGVGTSGSGSAAGMVGAGGTGAAGTMAGGASGSSSGTGGHPAQVGLPPGVTYLFPPPNGSALCPDPPLRMSFASAPTLGNAGKIQVFSMAGALVASVDMALPDVTDTIGGSSFSFARPVFVDGNDVVVYLKNKALAYAQAYYVTVDSGAIRPQGGASFSISGNSAWRFSTAPSAPADLSALRVALDGAGPFCSVQGALDALPASNSAKAVLTIDSGLYHEIVHMRGKNNVTLHGQDRKQTVILGTNNNDLNPNTATRSLVGFDALSGLIVENLTIHNLTSQGGSQAEALRLQSCDQCVVRNADILSLQDTLLWSGRVYADNCYIEGNVDYIWGTGVVYFNRCEIRTVGRSGVLVQSRNAAGAYGYVFVDSKLTADAAASSNNLARIDANAYPGSHVAYIDCQMSNVSAVGWQITGGIATSALRFWEYQSKDAAGNALNVSGRLSGSSQISSDQAAMMRDPKVVLGGWQPPM